MRTTISEAIEYFSDKTPKGEYVLVVEGAAPEKPSEGLTIDDAVEQARLLISRGMRAVDASKEAAKLTGFKKSDIYSRINSEDE